MGDLVSSLHTGPSTPFRSVSHVQLDVVASTYCLPKTCDTPRMSMSSWQNFDHLMRLPYLKAAFPPPQQTTCCRRLYTRILSPRSVSQTWLVTYCRAFHPNNYTRVQTQGLSQSSSALLPPLGCWIKLLTPVKNGWFFISYNSFARNLEFWSQK